MKNLIITVLLCFSMPVIAQDVAIDQGLEETVFEKYDALEMGSPTRQDPLAMNAAVVWSTKKDQLAVVMKVNLLEKWHIYAYAEENTPFIMSKIICELPKGIMPIGEWVKSESEASTDGLHIYEGELFFIRFYQVKDDSLIGKGTEFKCGLYYQTCDPNQCLPPSTKIKVLRL